MDYKELISKFRSDADCIRKHNMIGWADGYDLAADAIETLLAERDAALSILRGECYACKYVFCGCMDEPCKSCKSFVGAKSGKERDSWELRGPQKEDKHEAD